MARSAKLALVPPALAVVFLVVAWALASSGDDPVAPAPAAEVSTEVSPLPPAPQPERRVVYQSPPPVPAPVPAPHAAAAPTPSVAPPVTMPIRGGRPGLDPSAEGIELEPGQRRPLPRPRLHPRMAEEH